MKQTRQTFCSTPQKNVAETAVSFTYLRENCESHFKALHQKWTIRVEALLYKLTAKTQKNQNIIVLRSVYGPLSFLIWMNLAP